MALLGGGESKGRRDSSHLQPEDPKLWEGAGRQNVHNVMTFTNHGQGSKTPHSFSLSIWKLGLIFRKLTLNSQLWDGAQLGGLLTAHINGWTLLLLPLLFYMSVLVTQKLGGSFTVVPRREVI